ncbi:hypothetical protein [Reinekea sp.]|jgi:flagellar basal body P-ring protein FlgI|uniref:hypothetical protein n=1 Tax=Reinekea sp. TaxID=1970455 RepID=UPI00398A2A30
MRLFITSMLIVLSSAIFSEPLKNLVLINDGLDVENSENISDDYIRLTLLEPSYQSASSIKLSIEVWLGPDMVILNSKESLKVQAPRDSSQRIQFISALLALEISL